MTQKKVIYMALGGLLALLLVFGGALTFAQTGDDDTAVPDTAQEQPNETPDFDLPVIPNRGPFGRHNGFGEEIDNFARAGEKLAEALGISVEELQAAHEAAYTVAVEQAIAEELITQEQADELLSGEGYLRRRYGRFFSSEIDMDTLLADALGISVEELQDARQEAYLARLDAMVEAGFLTQEQADLAAARRAVNDYLDKEAVADMLREAYETAVEQALADGAITEAQATQLLENQPGLDRFGLRGGHRGGRGFPGGPGGFFAPQDSEPPPAIDSSGA